MAQPAGGELREAASEPQTPVTREGPGDLEGGGWSGGAGTRPRPSDQQELWRPAAVWAAGPEPRQRRRAGRWGRPPRRGARGEGRGARGPPPPPPQALRRAPRSGPGPPIPTLPKEAGGGGVPRPSRRNGVRPRGVRRGGASGAGRERARYRGRILRARVPDSGRREAGGHLLRGVRVAGSRGAAGSTGAGAAPSPPVQVLSAGTWVGRGAGGLRTGVAPFGR